MAGANLPGVIVNIMRAGPGLGNVYPEQGDYNQAVKGGGHGITGAWCWRRPVQEMCDLTMRAFELSLTHRRRLCWDGLLQDDGDAGAAGARATRPDTSGVGNAAPPRRARI